MALPRFSIIEEARSLGGCLRIELQFDAEPDLAGLEIEVAKRKATKGERLAIQDLNPAIEGQRVECSIPLLTPGRFQLILWDQEGERSPQESFALRPRFRGQELELLLRFSDDESAVFRFLQDLPFSAQIALSRLLLKPIPELEFDLERQILLLGKSTSTLANVKERPIFPGSLALYAKGSIGVSLGMARSEALVVASVVNGMGLIEQASKAPQDLRDLRLELRTHEAKA